MVSVVAHRGDSLRFRENTLAAIRSAVALGVDRVEIDVRTTADGVSVVLHDRTLLRLWGIPAAVEELTWDAVRQLGYGDLRVPRLEEVADVLAGTGIGLLVDAVDAHDSHTAWAALAAWRAARSVRPDDAAGATRGVGATGATDLLDVHWCGDPGAMAAVRDADPGAILHLATETGFADPELMRRLRPRYLNMEGSLLSPEVVRVAHEAGLLVSAWTIDDPVPMAAMVAFGADSVTTNRPGLFIRLRDAGHLADGLGLLAGGAGPIAPALGESGPGGGSSPSLEAARAAISDADLARAAGVAADLAGWAASYLRETEAAERAAKSHEADLVTDVDRAVERRVREVLADCFPDHAVVGEEEGGTPRPGRPTWYLDPVDGTTNYAHGLGWSSFSLALAVDETPLLGAVADPWRGEVLTAVAGGGARRDGVPLSRPTAPSLPGSVLLTEWQSHVPFPGQLDVLARLAQQHVTSRVMGSGTLSCVSVAADRAAGCLIGEFHPEDHLAATLIAREAGAVVLSEDGTPTAWPRGAFLVAAPDVADELLAAWRG